MTMELALMCAWSGPLRILETIWAARASDHSVRKWKSFVTFLSLPPSTTFMNLWNWSTSIAIKVALANAILLFYPKPNTPTSITTYAEFRQCSHISPPTMTWKSVAPNLLLLNKPNASWNMVQYLWLRAPSSAQLYFVEGQKFHSLTDPNHLMYAFSTHPDQHTPRQVHHLDYISQFTTDIFM